MVMSEVAQSRSLQSRGEFLTPGTEVNFSRRCRSLGGGRTMEEEGVASRSPVEQAHSQGWQVLEAGRSQDGGQLGQAHHAHLGQPDELSAVSCHELSAISCHELSAVMNCQLS